jgi:hypothetical protein
MSVRLIGILLVVAVLSFAGANAATSKRGPNGGPLVAADGHPIEFVHSEGEVVFYFTDDDGNTPLASKNLKGRAVIQDGGKTTTVPLSPSPPNKLVGKLKAPLSPKARVVVSASFSAGGHAHNLQARFTID